MTAYRRGMAGRQAQAYARDFCPTCGRRIGWLRQGNCPYCVPTDPKPTESEQDNASEAPSSEAEVAP